VQRKLDNARLKLTKEDNAIGQPKPR